MSSVSLASRAVAPPNWLDDAYTSIEAAKKNNGGLMGMLQSARGGNSIKSFLKRSANNANNFALISQNDAFNGGALVSQMAQKNIDRQNEAAMKKMMAELAESRNRVKPTNVLDSMIYFNDGSTIDTVANIRTTPDGTQYDTLTGALYVDPLSIVQMANGAYLDTKNNIMTMSDGTRIDITTGLKIEKKA